MRASPDSYRQAERAGVQDERPKGRDTAQPWLGSRQPYAIGGTPYTAQFYQEEAEMTCDELRELERARRRALWTLASLHPGDPNASELLAIFDDLDDQKREGTAPPDIPLELIEVRDSVTVQHHYSGIDIVLEMTIPQPWRERFLQASIGSTRLVDGLYATDWQKFLVEWKNEMVHLEKHRAAQDADSSR